MLPQQSSSNAGPSSRPVVAHRSGLKQSSTETPDFQAVVLCGYGDSLYPLTEGDNGTPKALLPIGPDLLLDRVLTWVEESGITEVLLLCPPGQMTSITNHIREAWPSTSHAHGHHPDAVPGVLSVGSGGGGSNKRPTSKKVGTKRVAGDHSRLQISIHGLDENQHLETSFLPPATTTTSPPTHAEKRPGTARILRRWTHHIQSDFVLLPCDISPPPGLKLEDLLDRHRREVGSLVTSLWYEKSELDLKDQDAPESVLVGFDRRSEQLLVIQPLEELEDDLELRMSLLSKYPDLSLTTRLLDAHVYAFRRSVLDLICTRDPKDLESVREDFLPWLVKGGWQDGLRERWSGVLESKADPLAAAIAKSTMSNSSTTVTLPTPSEVNTDQRQYSYTNSANPTVPSSPLRSPGETLLDFKHGLDPDLEEGQTGRVGSGMKRKKGGKADELPPLRCNMMVWRTPKPSESAAGLMGGRGEKVKAQGPSGEAAKEVEPVLIRGNTVAGYWELNREASGFLRSLAATTGTASTRTAPGAAPGIVDPDAPSPNIDPKSQISPDSLIAPTTKVGERTQIKKSIIGRHCVIGKNVRLTGCIVWDFVNIADGAKLENVILCKQVRVGTKAQVKDAEIGNGYQVPADSNIKGERLVAGQEVA